jgi:hypothetical protein
MPNAIPALKDTAGNSSEVPASFAVAITPDTELDQVSRGIYVGIAGDITVVMAGDGNVVLFASLPAGALLPIRTKLITASGTSASELVALY